MKAILTKKNLLEGIRTASHAIDARAVMPVLRHVLLSSEEGLTEEETWVRISGTDLQTVVSTVIPAQVLAPGEVTLPASVAAEIVGAFPEADVVLSSDDTGSQVRLECPPAEFNLVGLPPDEFPDLPEVPHDVWFEMDAGQLRAALRRTVFACSTDALRTILQGVLFNFVGHTLELAATDTFRLAVDTRVVGHPGGARGQRSGERRGPAARAARAAQDHAGSGKCPRPHLREPDQVPPAGSHAGVGAHRGAVPRLQARDPHGL